MLEGEKTEEEEQRRKPKREIEDIDKTSKTDKRLRLETNEETNNSKEITLHAIARDFNISSLEKRRSKSLRNRDYDVNAVAKGQISRLLRLTAQLPDVDGFHDKEKFEELSSHIAWDDLTGMKLEAGKVIEAREKEMGYIKKNLLWMQDPKSSCSSSRMEDSESNMNRYQQQRGLSPSV